MDATGAGNDFFSTIASAINVSVLLIQCRYLAIDPSWITHTDVEQTYFLYTHAR